MAEVRRESVRNNPLWWVLGFILLCLACSCLAGVVFFGDNVMAALGSVPRVQQPTQPAAPTQAPLPTTMPQPTNAPVTPAWDDTCVKQSTLVGVPLTPIKEGAFTACVYHGTPAKVTIPDGTMADVDLGGIVVAAGPVTIDGVPNLTLRPRRSGMNSELCAQVENLTAFGQTQSPKFTASPFNFTCP